MTRTLYTDEMLVLQNWLKNQRKSQKLTMQVLATRMARPHTFIHKVEQGERRLDVIEYLWYCEALGVNPHTGLDFVMNQTSTTLSPKK